MYLKWQNYNLGKKTCTFNNFFATLFARISQQTTRYHYNLIQILSSLVSNDMYLKDASNGVCVRPNNFCYSNFPNTIFLSGVLAVAYLFFFFFKFLHHSALILIIFLIFKKKMATLRPLHGQYGYQIICFLEFFNTATKKFEYVFMQLHTKNMCV